MNVSLEKKIRLAVGLSGLFSFLILLLAIYAFYSSHQTQKDYALVLEENRLLKETHSTLSTRLKQLQSKNHDIEQLLNLHRDKLSQSEQKRLEFEKQQAEKLLSEAEQQQATLEQRQLTFDSLKARLRQFLDPEAVSIHPSEDTILLRLSNTFLFDSKEIEVRRGYDHTDPTYQPPPDADSIPLELSDAEAVLIELAKLLREELPRYTLRVEGHSDNIPIGSSMKHRFPSNWELSAARATATVRYLHEIGGIPTSRMTAIGRADTHPIANNETLEGRQTNRRVDIILLPPTP